MPLKSLAQARWAYWARENASGSEQKAAREFINASPHGKGAYSHLPKRVKKSKPKRTFGSLAGHR
jgi:hypothetical protein